MFCALSRRVAAFGIVVGLLASAGGGLCLAEEPAAPESRTADSTEISSQKHSAKEADSSGSGSRLPPPKEAKPMPKSDQVWVDAKRGEVLMDGYVSLREGYLEMFACLVGTKEHESVVAVACPAQVVHAALLAVGAKPGRPVQFHPEFAPPSGTTIDVQVRWLESDGKWKSSAAQQWIKQVASGKPMKESWVFAGSGFWKHPETNEQIYMAEAGDFICVSNFSTAMLDIPVPSSQVNDGLLFEANTEQIPPLGTPVRVVLKPQLKKQPKEKP